MLGSKDSTESSRVVRTLVGKKSFACSLICLKSLRYHFQEEHSLEILDDGTLEGHHIEQLEEQVTDSKVTKLITRESEILQALSRFSHCLNFRKQNLLSYKLFDVMILGRPESLFYVDSDIYFVKDFRIPQADLVFFPDTASAYSISCKQALRNPRGLRSKINTGLILCAAKYFDLDFLNWLLKPGPHLLQFLKTPCWAEQTCWAMMASKHQPMLISREQARVVSSEEPLVIDDKLVALHFVSSARGRLDQFISQEDETATVSPQELTLESPRYFSAGEYLLEGFKRRYLK